MDQLINQYEALKDRFPDLLDWGLSLVGTLLSALLILMLGIFIGRWMRGRLRKSKLGGSHLDTTLRPVIASVVFYIIIAMTLYAVLIKVGVPASSLIAVFGAAGLAIGLALKDTLANIAAGVMLLVLRPLKVGDFVDMPTGTGTIEEIGLFSSTLRNLENVAVYIPNSAIWGARIQNFGRHVNRKAIIDIGVGYATDLEQAQQVIIDVMRAQPDMMEEPNVPEVLVQSFGDSAINLSCRVWLPGDNWLQRASDLRIAIKKGLDKAEIEIPFPQRVVTMRTEED